MTRRIKWINHRRPKAPDTIIRERDSSSAAYMVLCYNGLNLWEKTVSKLFANKCTL